MKRAQRVQTEQEGTSTAHNFAQQITVAALQEGVTDGLAMLDHAHQIALEWEIYPDTAIVSY